MNAAGNVARGVTFLSFKGRILTSVLPFFFAPLMWRGFYEIVVLLMSKDPAEPRDRSYQNSLYEEDQKKVDEFIKTGINSVERKPFRPMRLLVLLVVVVVGLSLFSQFLARWAGIY